MTKLVQIAAGNHKLGKNKRIMGTVSLSPGASCRPDAPCWINRRCSNGPHCYCYPIIQRYEASKKAWARNLKLALSNPQEYFAQIEAYLMKYKPIYWRWHTSGDMLGRASKLIQQAYFDNVKRIAEKFPQTKFLIFTKLYSLDFTNLPTNLRVRFSIWPGLKDTAPIGPRCFVLDLDNPDSRITKDAILCPGKCEDCYICWELERDVKILWHN